MQEELHQGPDGGRALRLCLRRGCRRRRLQPQHEAGEEVQEGREEEQGLQEELQEGDGRLRVQLRLMSGAGRHQCAALRIHAIDRMPRTGWIGTRAWVSGYGSA